MASREVETVLRCYPQIYFACHRRHVRDEQSQQVLSSNQASILDHLDAVEGTNLLELARHMGVTASTMSISVDKLVGGGWIRRDQDRDDGRRICLRLTCAGARMKAAQTVLDARRVGKVLERLTQVERTDALRGLALLARASAEEISSWTKGGR